MPQQPGGHHGSKRERDDRPGRRGVEQMAGALEERKRADRLAAAGMHLEVEVRHPTVRVARVPDEADRLTRLDGVAVVEPLGVGGPGHALAAVVVPARQVVVQVDVEVRGPALAVQVEHAAGARGGRPEPDLAVLRRDRERALRREDVVPLVRPARARRAEVVEVLHGPDDGEDDPGRLRLRRELGLRPFRRSARGRRRKVERARGHGRPCGDAGSGEEDEDPSGCRPVAGHALRFALEGPHPSRRLSACPPAGCSLESGA